MKNHHRKRHPMSEGERVIWEICFDLTETERWRSFLAYAESKAFRLAKKRRERDALRDAGRNPYNGFGQFRNMLSYKMEERGKKLITIDKWFPSSKTCRHCGYVNSDLTLNDREWVCPSCGAKIDRDVNAAINIKTEGLRNVS